jgi:hypothetical protein
MAILLPMTCGVGGMTGISYCAWLLFFETASCNVPQIGRELTILLLSLPSS